MGAFCHAAAGSASELRCFWPDGAHRVWYVYPDWVQAKARQTVTAVIAMGQAPFQVLER